MNTRMISFDTSTTTSGFACFVNGIIKDSGVIDFKKEKDSVIRRENMCIALKQKIKTFKPDIVVVERPPLVRSPYVLIELAEIVGVVKGCAIDNCEYIEYSVTEWRKFVKDKDETLPRGRKELKMWDIDKFNKVFGYMPIDDNEADAGLIGLARINQIKKYESEK